MDRLGALIRTDPSSKPRNNYFDPDHRVQSGRKLLGRKFEEKSPLQRSSFKFAAFKHYLRQCGVGTKLSLFYVS